MNGSKKPGRPKGVRGKKEILSEYQVDLVVESIMNTNRSNRCRNIVLILFNHYLGMKAVDLVVLKVSDVYDGKAIFGSLIVNKVEPVIALKFNKKLYIALELLIKSRIENEGKSFDCNSALFKSQKNTFSPSTLARLINKIYQDAGFSNTTSHSGKRSYLKKLVTQQHDIKTISRMTGDVAINVRRYLDEYI